MLDDRVTIYNTRIGNRQDEETREHAILSEEETI